MHCLSFFGFFIIFFSFYLLIFVPTKLDIVTRFVIHGLDLTSAIAQLSLTLGLTPTFVFPCSSTYTNGYLSTVGMSVKNQMWIQTALLGVSAGFSILLTINRVFATSSRLKKYKNLIIITFLTQMIGQIVFVFLAGMNLRCGGKRARQTCIQILPYKYPKEMYTFRGCDLSLPNSGVRLLFSYVGLITIMYMGIGSACCAALVQSIRKQAKSSQSNQFLANQRRINLGILYFIIVEVIGLCGPFLIISGCALFNEGNMIVSDFAFICMSIYPVFGPYYVLMSNTDYRNKVKGVLRKAQELGTRHLSG